MTQQQKDVIIQFCNQIDGLDISNIIINYNVNQVGQYSVEIFDSLVKRIVKQLIEELQNGIGIFLPIQYNYNNEFGGGILESDLQNFLVYLPNIQYYINCEAILNRLIYSKLPMDFGTEGKGKFILPMKLKPVIFRLGYLA